MKKIKFLLLTSFLLIAISSNAQIIGDTEIKSSTLTSWETTQENYYGYYDFGFSESESILHIFLDSTSNLKKIKAELSASDWNNKTKSWDPVTKKLKRVRIEGDRFFSDQFNGKFVIYTEEDGKNYEGLQVIKPWYSLLEGEVGIKEVDEEK